MKWTSRTIFLSALIWTLVGCAQDTANAADPPPQDKGGQFASATNGISVTWPAGWQQHPTTEYTLLLWPNGAESDPSRWISLDVPELPFHIPGLIPMSRVRSGYLNNLQKKHGQIATQDLPSPKIADAKINFFRSTWTESGQNFADTALLLIHDDRIYILRVRSDAEHDPAVREAFDQIVSSLKWTPAK